MGSAYSVDFRRHSRKGTRNDLLNPYADSGFDKLAAAKRRALMSKIRSSDTKPERVMRTALRQRGLRFRTDYGAEHADFAFPSAKVALFVDGCFWHGCPKHYVPPRNNATYWKWKVGYNRRRDSKLRTRLREAGWVVFRVWEHSLPMLANRYAETVARRVRRRTLRSAWQRHTRPAGGPRFRVVR